MKGYKTYLVSLDPAHNIGDVLGVDLSDEPRKVCDNLWAIEIDYDSIIKRYLKELSSRIKDIYGYLKIFNLDKYIVVLRHSPGVEEQASLDKIIEIIREYGEKHKANIIVFDTPPTGLMLRLMILPSISLIWIKKLLELRLVILERRKALAKLTGEKFEITLADRKMSIPVEASEDPIYNELIRLMREYTWINNILSDQSKTYVALVINPELLSVLEAYRAYNFLNKIGITTRYIIINKVLKTEKVLNELKLKLEEQEKAIKLALDKFRGKVFIEIPYFPREPRGFEELKNIVKYVELID